MNHFYFHSFNGRWYLYSETDVIDETTVISCDVNYHVESFESEEELLIKANLMGVVPRRCSEREDIDIG